jgi:hypothetical protein
MGPKNEKSTSAEVAQCRRCKTGKARMRKPCKSLGPGWLAELPKGAHTRGVVAEETRWGRFCLTLPSRPDLGLSTCPGQAGQ